MLYFTAFIDTIYSFFSKREKPRTKHVEFRTPILCVPSPRTAQAEIIDAGYNLTKDMQQIHVESNIIPTTYTTIESFCKQPSHSDMIGTNLVILCDNDDKNHELIKAYFTNLSGAWKLDCKSTASELLEYFTVSNIKPDLLLIDYNLPDMDGIKLTTEIRKKHTSIVLPILLTTCVSDDKLLLAAFDAGANDFLVKPINHLEFIARLQTHVALKKSMRLAIEGLYNTKLLKEIIPHHLLCELKENGSVNKYHESVSILFTDIVGFTELCSKWETKKIINMLDNMYTRFDKICEVHGVFKVETIGDSYMAVAGHHMVDKENSPNNQDHAKKILKVAEDMLHAVTELSELYDEKIEIRIGAHTGMAHSGIIGLSRPRYCFFGDTVNTASRMESHGFPMVIHVSESFFNATEQPYNFTFRGCVKIKGKGNMNTYIFKDSLGKWKEFVNYNSILKGESGRLKKIAKRRTSYKERAAGISKISTEINAFEASFSDKSTNLDEKLKMLAAELNNGMLDSFST